jgi:hypothetical protein
MIRQARLFSLRDELACRRIPVVQAKAITSLSLAVINQTSL